MFDCLVLRKTGFVCSIRRIVPIAVLVGSVALGKPVFTDDDSGETLENLPVAVEGKRTSEKYSWEQAESKVSDKGDIEWSPKPFCFVKGSSVRYIDFEKGSDSNIGTSSDKPWKHHPKDPAASGAAKTDSGADTYVFKRGVFYRGNIELGTISGKPGKPIRFTSDPSWGEGDAVICGSEVVTGWQKGRTHAKIPEGNEIWYADLDYAPRNIWATRKGKVFRVPLARTPNWRESNPDDVLSELWVFDNKGIHPFKNIWKNYCGAASQKLKGLDSDYVKGAYIWSEWSWVMSTPYPSRVVSYDPDKGLVYFGGVWGSGSSMIIMRGCRFYLEDKPHYLDDPRGEFWFEKKGSGGRLHMIFPQGVKPSDVTVEAAKRIRFIRADEMNHVEFSGLAFRYNNVMWDLDHPDYRDSPDLNPACIRLDGRGRDITVRNCKFKYVHTAVNLHTGIGSDSIDDVLICDNEIRFTDYAGINLNRGCRSLLEGRKGVARDTRLINVKILRNYMNRVGFRPSRYGQGPGLTVQYAENLEVAGNVLEEIYGLGMSFWGGKIGDEPEAPLVRVLVHNNKVIQPLMKTNDYGGIETWQGGPFYVYNNISGKTGGYQSFNNANFGHAYYQDGAYKNYLFNNIGWGIDTSRNGLPRSCSALQSIHAYQNTYANNTFYRFKVGARRQSPKAGRNKYLGSIWQDFSERVFRTANPAKTKADANAHHAGGQGTDFHHETNAYAKNILYQVKEVGVFDESGRWLDTLDEFSGELKKAGTLVADVGKMASASPLRDPANLDFRPTDEALDYGVQIFVPWGLYAMVGEWNFYKPALGQSEVFDEHWFMTSIYKKRDYYYEKPTFPLTLVNVDGSDFCSGPLEDWVEGAMNLNGVDQYAVLPDSKLKDFNFKQGKEETNVSGADFKNPQIYKSNFLIEVYFKTAPDFTDGLLVGKMSGAGYSLKVNKSGGITFAVNGGGTDAKVMSRHRINNGKWHHVIAECDRSAEALVLYINGRKDSEFKGINGAISLENEGDFFVGGTPVGKCLKGTIDFVRIAQGTLKDSNTDINELYAWQFDGPFLRDFAGRKPVGRRDCGALEFVK